MNEKASIKKLKLVRSIKQSVELRPDETGEEFVNRIEGDLPHELDETIIENRGEILNSAIYAEESLETMLQYLLESKKFSSDSFCNNLFVQKGVDFNVKFQMLRALTETHEQIKKDEKEWKEFRGNLSQLINIRNQFAHGRILFKGEQQPYLIYIEGKKPKEIKLDNDYWGKIEDIFISAQTQATGLLDKLFNFLAEEQDKEWEEAQK